MLRAITARGEGRSDGCGGRRMLKQASVLLALFAFMAVGAGAGSTSTRTTAANGKIVFASDRADITELGELLRGPPPPPPPPPQPPPPWAIFVMNADGAQIDRITDFGENWDPAWSPDGTRIAFATHRDFNPYNTEIYVMNADGSNLVQLTHNTAIDGDPDWSPDGEKIVFTSTLGGNYELWVMNADGTDLHRVREGPGLETSGAWSPDGASIAFMSDMDAPPPPPPPPAPPPPPPPPPQEIYVMSPDGSDVRRLTNNAAWDSMPAW